MFCCQNKGNWPWATFVNLHSSTLSIKSYPNAKVQLGIADVQWSHSSSTKTNLGIKFKTKEKKKNDFYIRALLSFWYQLKFLLLTVMSLSCLQTIYKCIHLSLFRVVFFSTFHFITFTFILDTHMANHSIVVILKHIAFYFSECFLLERDRIFRAPALMHWLNLKWH